MSDPHVLNVAYSIGLYTYGILGWPCQCVQPRSRPLPDPHSLLLLHRTLVPLLRARRQRQRRVGHGVTITVETVHHIDSIDDKPSQPTSHLDFAVLALRQEARDARSGYPNSLIVHLPSVGRDLDLARLDKFDDKA